MVTFKPTKPPPTFNGDKTKFTDWFRHVEMYWACIQGATDEQKVLGTCLYMNNGPAATWSGAYSKTELTKPRNDPHRCVWSTFVTMLKEAYAPISKMADAQAHLCRLKQGTVLTDQYIILFRQVLSDAGYPSTITSDTPEADHVIDVLKMNMNPMLWRIASACTRPATSRPS